MYDLRGQAGLEDMGFMVLKAVLIYSVVLGIYLEIYLVNDFTEKEAGLRGVQTSGTT